MTPPWGDLTAVESCPTDMPTTHVTRCFDWYLTRGTLSPDGVPGDVILVNGEFPGPVIEANWGDNIEVNVHNEIYGPEETTVMHWHGMNQLATPWADGVATISHCPIIPGQNFTYKFQANKYGTSWWHSHLSSQYASGLQGPMVFHGPPSAPYDIDLGPVILIDWYHDDYETNVAKATEALSQYPKGFIPYDSSSLINGKGFYPCANVSAAPCDNSGGPLDNEPGNCTDAPVCAFAGLSQFKFMSGKKHLLRLVNTGAALFTAFTIDNHTMTVISNDFTPVVPYETTVVTLGVGQRSDVIVEANGEPGEAYWMRSTANSICSPSNNPDGRAVIYYEGAEKDSVPQTTGQVIPVNTGCCNDPLAEVVPSCPIAAVAEPDYTFEIDITYQTNATGSSRWYMNNVSFQGDYNTPILLDAVQGQTTFPPERNVYNLGSYSTVRLIVNNHWIPSHPMHLHSHDFQILSFGSGAWNGSIVNAGNPIRRDTNMLGANAGPANQTYVVFQWAQDNPGVWPFHCHIAWHLSGGLGAQFLERAEDVAKLVVPQEYFDSCPTFNTWEQNNNNTLDEYDSGE